MSRLLEILGGAVTVDVTDLIWHWLDTVQTAKVTNGSAQERQLKKVIKLLGDRKTETAGEQLRLYLFENPGCIYGRLATAAICIAKNQLHSAIEELNSVYLRQPNNTLALYALGYCYERIGKKSQAVEFYQDCLKFKNYLQLPRQRLGAIYFKDGQLEKTIQEYELLKDEYPDDIPALVTLGHLYIANAGYDKAIETFNTAILIHPDNFHSQNDPLDELIATGQLEDAAVQLDDLLQEQPGRVDLLVKRADVLSMLGAKQEAVQRYEEAIHICPNYLEAAIKLGSQYLQLGEEQSAAQQFNKATEINDRIVDAYIGLATAQKLGGSTSDALVTLSLAAAIDANSAILFAEAASLQFRAGFSVSSPASDDEQSNEVIEAVIGAHQQQVCLRPQNPDLQYRFGVLMMGAGKMKEAIKAFENALAINPTYSRAGNKLALSLFETGQKQLALEQLTKPECLDKATLELHYRIALLYCDKIKFASSLMNLDRLLESNFAYPDTTVNISIVLQNLGLLDRAAVTWDNLSDTTKQAINTNYPFSPNGF